MNQLEVTDFEDEAIRRSMMMHRLSKAEAQWRAAQTARLR
jgi:hypothetical protein